MMLASLEVLLIEANERFGAERLNWVKAIAEGRYRDAEEAYSRVSSAWNGVQGCWARLQVEIRMAQGSKV